jgi:hypothetical protein
MPINASTIAAGMLPPKQILKTGIAMAAANGARGYNMRYVAGGALAAPSAGINGANVSLGGVFPRTNPASGITAYLARFGITASAIGTAWLIDRIWENSGLSVTSTTAQAISAATLAARDANGTTNGAQIMAAVEWSATGGAGTPTVTLTYTDQDGNTGATAAFTGVATPPVGTFELFPLAAGDTGIRLPTSFIQSATRTSGTMHLVLFRVLAQVGITAANVEAAVDAWTGGRPQLYDGTSPEVVFFPAATTATNFSAQYIETQLDAA